MKWKRADVLHATFLRELWIIQALANVLLRKIEEMCGNIPYFSIRKIAFGPLGCAFSAGENRKQKENSRIFPQVTQDLVFTSRNLSLENHCVDALWEIVL